MKLSLILLILVSISLSSGSQVLLKLGMSSAEMQAVLAESDKPLRIIMSMVGSPLVLTGLACYGLSAVVWLFVLSRIPVSTAYPFVSLGIVITVVAGRLFLNEPISLLKTFGIFLILSGVISIGVSP
jgi:multidrug transporter EmrE-like cation transporter